MRHALSIEFNHKNYLPRAMANRQGLESSGYEVDELFYSKGGKRYEYCEKTKSQIEQFIAEGKYSVIIFNGLIVRELVDVFKTITIPDSLEMMIAHSCDLTNSAFVELEQLVSNNVLFKKVDWDHDVEKSSRQIEKLLVS